MIYIRYTLRAIGAIALFTAIWAGLFFAYDYGQAKQERYLQEKRV